MNLKSSQIGFSRIIPLLIGVLYLLLAIASVVNDDITYDEQDHLNYGVSILKGVSSRQQPGADFNTTMPVSALNAIPRATEQLFNADMHRLDGGISDTKNGRYITIIVTLLLLGYVYVFAKNIAGSVAGCWAMLLVATDPNILAHSRLVTTDVYNALAFVAVLFHLYRWKVDGVKKHFYYWCIAIAVAQCCKINNILLYPICLLIILFFRMQGNQFSFKVAAYHLLTFLLIQLLVINSLFLFYHTGYSFADYHFKSQFFQQLQQSWIGNIPIPLPQSFIDTFDLTQFERETFTGTAQNYLLGELRYRKGFWNYYIVNWVVKTPLLTQIISVVAFVTALLSAVFRKRAFLFVVIPTGITLFLLSSSSVQGGYRYLLPLLLLLLIASGVFISYIQVRIKPIGIYAISILIAIPAIIGFPNYISYTSEWLVPKKKAYRYVSDSNLNWGQRSVKINTILKNHPEYIFEPAAPATGMIVVDINKLTGIIQTEKFEWLRKNYQPESVIEGCYLLYNIRQLP